MREWEREKEERREREKYLHENIHCCSNEKKNQIQHIQEKKIQIAKQKKKKNIEFKKLEGKKFDLNWMWGGGRFKNTYEEGDR